MTNLSQAKIEEFRGLSFKDYGELLCENCEAGRQAMCGLLAMLSYEPKNFPTEEVVREKVTYCARPNLKDQVERILNS